MGIEHLFVNRAVAPRKPRGETRDPPIGYPVPCRLAAFDAEGYFNPKGCGTPIPSFASRPQGFHLVPEYPECVSRRQS